MDYPEPNKNNIYMGIVGIVSIGLLSMITYIQSDCSLSKKYSPMLSLKCRVELEKFPSNLEKLSEMNLN